MSGHVGRHDRALLDAAAITAELICDPAVPARWADASALAKLSVGALACHLGRQVAFAADLLTAVTDLPTLQSVDEHYARAPWVSARSVDDPVNDRSTDDADAALGHDALVTRVAADLATVRDVIATARARDVVPIPWQGWSLRRDDFAVTRMLEMVVHGDDLAISVRTATPTFPDDVFAPVRDLLVRLAVRRHGQSAVISTLTRGERARPINAF